MVKVERQLVVEVGVVLGEGGGSRNRGVREGGREWRDRSVGVLLTQEHQEPLHPAWHSL